VGLLSSTGTPLTLITSVIATTFITAVITTLFITADALVESEASGSEDGSGYDSSDEQGSDDSSDERGSSNDTSDECQWCTCGGERTHSRSCPLNPRNVGEEGMLIERVSPPMTAATNLLHPRNQSPPTTSRQGTMSAFTVMPGGSIMSPAVLPKLLVESIIGSAFVMGYY